MRPIIIISTDHECGQQLYLCGTKLNNSVIDFGKPASEAFQILRSYNYEVKLFSEDGDQVFEPDMARRMFCLPANMLLSLVEDGDNSSLRLYLSKSTEIAQLQGLISTLRNISYKYNMLFNVRKYGRELRVADFATKASVREAQGNKMNHLANKVGDAMNVFEGMYGTTRSSYLALENARMKVKHRKRIDASLIGARGRNIQEIFIENAQGERFLFPSHNLPAARAMTQHVNQGGTFQDPVGANIIEMANHYGNLLTASRHIRAHENVLDESAHEMRSNIREEMQETRRIFERMFRPKGYASESTRIKEQATTLTEDGEQTQKLAEQVGQLRGLLTVEGIDLSDTVLESVAKALQERELRMGGVDEARAPKLGPTIKVLGKPVDQAAWTAFKSGQLDLVRNPFEGGGETPHFKSRTAELSFKLGEIARSTKDDSLANLFSAIAEMLTDMTGRGGGTNKWLSGNPGGLDKMRRIGMAALRASGSPLGEEATLTSPVIKEYNDWINEHTPENIFTEEPYNGDAGVDMTAGGQYDNTQLGSTDTFTFTAEVNGQNATVTATNHPASVGQNGDENDSPANISIDQVTSPTGQEMQIDDNMTQTLQQQAVSEYANRVGDDDYNEYDGPMNDGEQNESMDAGLAEDDLGDHDEDDMDEAVVDDTNFNRMQAGSMELNRPPHSARRSVAQAQADIEAKRSGNMRQPNMPLKDAMMSLPQQSPEPEIGATTDQSVPVNDPLGGDGEIEFASCDDGGGEELNSSDIVLPTNQGRDLARDIRVTTSHDDAGNPVKVDPAYISRLQQLAGVRRGY